MSNDVGDDDQWLAWAKQQPIFGLRRERVAMNCAICRKPLLGDPHYHGDLAYCADCCPDAEDNAGDLPVEVNHADDD
jgi:hypothetical protein